MTETPGACIIKLITAIIYGFRNKLVFVPKHWTRLETLARDKHSSLFVPSVSNDKKNYNIDTITIVPSSMSDTSGLYHKTYYGHNLRFP